MRKASCKKRVTRSSYRVSAFKLIMRLTSTVDPSLLPPGNYVKRILGACRARDVLRLLEIAKELDQPQMYADPGAYALATQLAAFIKKVPFSVGVTDAIRRLTAISSFERAEKLCRISNRRLSHYGSHLDRMRDAELRSVFIRSRRIIYETLGDLNSESLSEIISEGRHGPGASTDTKDKARSSGYYKYSLSELSVSRMAEPYARFAVTSNPTWWHLASQWKYVGDRIEQRLCFRLQEHNRVAFVPKNATTHRGIAVENTMNVFLQLGVHEYISRRLKRHQGIDIHSQLRNQRLALLGSSPSRDLATIDLSMASDTVSRSVVEQLFPNDWVGLLDDLRSKYYVHPVAGSTCIYDKWSSMGNGYTFVLETLIFTAIIRASAEVRGVHLKRTNFGVYGDDLVIPGSLWDLVTKSLTFFGFIPNPDKSFKDGVFRESCGADFFACTPVRPLFIRSEQLDLIELFNLANGFSRRNQDGFFEAVLSCIPDRFRNFVPNHAEDTDGIKAPVHWLYHNGHLRYVHAEQRYKYRRYVYRTKSEDVDGGALLLTRLARRDALPKWDAYGFIDSIGCGNSVGLRDTYGISKRWSGLLGRPDRQTWPSWFYREI